MFETLNNISTVCEGYIFNEEIKYEEDIINIFNGNILKETNNDFLLNIIDLYYEYIEKNYNEMKKYYLMAIELNNVEAMYNLGRYYDENEEYDKIEYAYQEEALGTGHAIMCSLYNLAQYTEHKVLILSGDVPLISKETLSSLNSEYEDRMLITDLDIPKACGRIIFNEDKTKVDDIIEEKECNNEQKLINYINCGIYQITVQNLFKFVPLIDNNNKTGEFYLTDIVKLMKNNREQIGFYDLPKEKQYEIKNVNTKEDLDKLNEDIKDIVKK